ncbi:MAG: hypothetical protein IKE76_00785 [Clostridia bacterium]|nr:hypothetical protein [Clostridia bacterium]
MSKSNVPMTQAEVLASIEENGPVMYGDFRLRRALPETYSGASGGRPFAGFSCWGECAFGSCECLWECYEGEVPDWDDPHWIYVYTSDGWDVLVGGSRM